MKLAVIGDPVDHSRSPQIFSRLFARLGIEGSYEKVRVTQDELPGFLDDVRAGEFDGLSITLPLKADATILVDKRTPRAQRTGAINCVHVRAGRLLGDNTDVAGVRRALALAAPELDVSKSRALILGASGAARAAVVALSDAKVTIANRTLARARAVAHSFGVGHLALGDAKASDFDLIVNATSVGVTSDDVLLPDATFAEGQVVLDMNYIPRVTPLLTRASEAGARVVDGLWMLVFQALEQAEVFGLGRRDVADALDLYRHISDDEPSRDRALITAGRARINEIDRALVASLGERVRVARELGPAKQALGLPVVRPERETELRALHDDWASDAGLDAVYVRGLFDLVLNRSRAEQAPPTDAEVENDK